MLRLANVTKIYDGGTVAVHDISLDIQRGEFVFLVGPSGSGKSTLIKLMLKQEPVTHGTIWVAGKDITVIPNWKVPYLRRSVGTVFQDFKLLPNKTVRENVAFALEVIGRPNSVIGPQVGQVLELVGLADKGDRYPRQLSGGEQQRVSVARAFVNRPPILLADEPTGNLDPTTSVGIMRLLDRINRTGTTVVMATHDHAIVDAMKRRVVELEGGKMMRDQSEGRYEIETPTAVIPTVSPSYSSPASPPASSPVVEPTAPPTAVTDRLSPEPGTGEVPDSADGGGTGTRPTDHTTPPGEPSDRVATGQTPSPIDPIPTDVLASDSPHPVSNEQPEGTRIPSVEESSVPPSVQDSQTSHPAEEPVSDTAIPEDPSGTEPHMDEPGSPESSGIDRPTEQASSDPPEPSGSSGMNRSADQSSITSPDESVSPPVITDDEEQVVAGTDPARLEPQPPS